MYALLGADKGCLSAMAAVGYCLLTGYGVAKDEDRGIRMVRESASAFCASGMYAAEWRCPCGGDISCAQAQLFLGTLFSSSLAARRYALGVAYERGIGCERDEFAAFKSYKSAAMLGNAAAQYSCALLQSRSHGCSPRQEISAATAVVELFFSLASIHDHHLHRDSFDAQQSYSLMQEAAAQGHPRASIACALATLYSVESGSDSAVQEAVAALTKQAMRESPAAQHCLAELLCCGCGVVSK
jgi:TPR repeat protein